jgi:hypothetical protein
MSVSRGDVAWHVGISTPSVSVLPLRSCTHPSTGCVQRHVRQTPAWRRTTNGNSYLHVCISNLPSCLSLATAHKTKQAKQKYLSASYLGLGGL